MTRYLLWKRWSLLTRFSVLSLVVLAAIALALAYGLEQKIIHNALEQEARSAADQVDLVINPLLQYTTWDEPLAPALYRVLDQRVRERIVNEHIPIVKVWNSAGLLLYSTTADEAGKSYPLSDELRAALGGGMGMELSSLVKPENVGERALAARLLEVYVPIYAKDRQTVVGAYEIYHDLSVVESELNDTRQFLLISLGAGFMFLYVSLFAIVRSASRQLVQRNRENARRAEQLRVINEVGQQLTAILEVAPLMRKIVQVVKERLGYDRVVVASVDGEWMRRHAWVGFETTDHRELDKLPRLRVGKEGIVGHAAASAEPLLVNDVRREPRFIKFAPHDPTRAELAVPLRLKGETVGVIDIQSNRLNAFDADDVALLQALSVHAAIAIENARLFEETRVRLEELSTLFNLSTALRTAQNVDEMLPIILHHATTVAHAEGGALLLLGPQNGAPPPCTASGTLSALHEQALLIRDLLAAEMLWQDDTASSAALLAHPTVPALLRAVLSEQEHGIWLPMRTTTDTVGLLALAYREAHAVSESELRLLKTIANQAANAIHRASLLERTQEQAQRLAQLLDELEASYDATLAALSEALDARDRETEGHSRRVAALTRALAEEMGIRAANELACIERGALLHDVGKIGISDRILLKPGPLTAEEWSEMRKHPELGAKIVERVTFLKDAVPIILYHQERYDGSGYPRGLSGAEIPLAARIFALADVYDALTCDRPYRPAMSHAAALAEIESRRGTWFDPVLVEVFFKLMRGARAARAQLPISAF